MYHDLVKFLDAVQQLKKTIRFQ